MPAVPFQKLSLVRLITPTSPVPDSPEDGDIHAAHIRYLSGLIEEGKILVHGPVRRLDDPRLRGMSLYPVGAEEAREYAQKDPAVLAGWFEVLVDEWLIPARPTQIGDRVDGVIDVPD